MKNSLKVTKNKKKALDTKIVFIKKLMSNSLIINADIKKEIINNKGFEVGKMISVNKIISDPKIAKKYIN